MEEQTETRAHEIAAVLKVVSDSGSRLETAGADVSKAASEILASSEAQKGTTQTLATHLGEASNKQNEALKDVIARLGSLESLEKRLSELPNAFSSNVPRPSVFSNPSQGIEPTIPSVIERLPKQRFTPSPSTHWPKAAELSFESTVGQASPNLGIVPPQPDDLKESSPMVASQPVTALSPDCSKPVDFLPLNEGDDRDPMLKNSEEQLVSESADGDENQVEGPKEKKGLFRRIFFWRK
jgi:hypothetical protein